MWNITHIYFVLVPNKIVHMDKSYVFVDWNTKPTSSGKNKRKTRETICC